MKWSLFWRRDICGLCRESWKICSDCQKQKALQFTDERGRLKSFNFCLLLKEDRKQTVICLGLEPKTPTLKVLCSTYWASRSRFQSFAKVHKYFKYTKESCWFSWRRFKLLVRFTYYFPAIQLLWSCSSVFSWSFFWFLVHNYASSDILCYYGLGKFLWESSRSENESFLIYFRYDMPVIPKETARSKRLRAVFSFPFATPGSC